MLTKSFTIEWGGEEYEVRPTIALMNRIEDRGVSIVGLINAAATGNPMFAKSAIFLSEIIKAGGGKVSAEDMWAELVGEKTVEVCTLVVDVASRCLGGGRDPKKDGAPQKGAEST